VFWRMGTCLGCCGCQIGLEGGGVVLTEEKEVGVGKKKGDGLSAGKVTSPREESLGDRTTGKKRRRHFEKGETGLTGAVGGERGKALIKKGRKTFDRLRSVRSGNVLERESVFLRHRPGNGGFKRGRASNVSQGDALPRGKFFQNRTGHALFLHHKHGAQQRQSDLIEKKHGMEKEGGGLSLDGKKERGQGSQEKSCAKLEERKRRADRRLSRGRERLH